jgi:adenosylcobinamide-phosphate synthase
MLFAELALLTLVLESVIGYPDKLNKRIPHPVIWFGRLITLLDSRFNLKSDNALSQKRKGIAALIIFVLVALMAGLMIQGFLSLFGGIGFLILVLVATTGLAQLSLDTHVQKVYQEIVRKDLIQARNKVSMIVGRDTSNLSETEVITAALESLSESFNDGVVAPAFWLLVAGLPGLCVYKIVNTADSMIGHKNEQYKNFGWAAAKFDDLLNYIPARIAGLLIVIAARRGLITMCRQAKLHDSPNAGWPEAAMAGALKIKLGGPATYSGQILQRPVFGSGQYPNLGDFKRGIRISRIAHFLFWGIILILVIS